MTSYQPLLLADNDGQSTVCAVEFDYNTARGFRGRQIERRHFQLDQIQDDGGRPFWKTSKGQIS